MACSRHSAEIENRGSGNLQFIREKYARRLDAMKCKKLSVIPSYDVIRRVLDHCNLPNDKFRVTVGADEPSGLGFRGQVFRERNSEMLARPSMQPFGYRVFDCHDRGSHGYPDLNHAESL